ncbi:NAD(P)/FAD-dependent oxidoreductase [Actinoalloteichus hymeniacidonis]|uniref:Glycine/D-amino acid oxidase, deaminating n=1 Tax=Actinoalloteichus hymeniacidonis TaxID=340345 RepID=A0AAC9MXW0_9PSEU|nr:FAD-dependent oxidoreductase [Actinoalloteichus hymeniacidonis]AOS63763.1 glycine/D-amino acid oxidase, deaminating [Actinoalloteichus hymeniacidonis]MBB5908183.1 glycine/D-amino acid oxidase-like deaminating enzyme [Actinoalloteichus hymeniacidonis]
MTEIVVIGAGIVGAACARTLSRLGHRVRILDRGPAMTGTSASCEGNLLVSDKGPGAELDLALAANAGWPAIVAELADELGPAFPAVEFEKKGGLVVATTEAGAQPLIDFAAEQRAAGVDAQVVSDRQARELEPDLTPDFTAAVYYPQDCQVQPVAVGEALLASARRHGAEIRTGVEVLGGIRRRDRLVGLRTSQGDIPADAVVLAAGPWSGEVSDRIGAPVAVRPRRGMVLVTTRMPHRIFHKVYDGDYVGATQSADAALQTSSVVESTAAGTVLIGSSREQVGFDPSIRVDVLREIARKAVTLFPFLSSVPVMRAYGGFRPYLDDHLPLIGADPRLPGLWHASGHEGAGIGLSVITAQLLAADLFGGPAPLDPTPFRPTGRPLVAPDLVVNGGAA